jgi:hypothetical protein
LFEKATLLQVFTPNGYENKTAEQDKQLKLFDS